MRVIDYTRIFILGLPDNGLSEDVIEIIRELSLKNFIFFRPHFHSAKKFHRLISNLKKIVGNGLFTVDQEGGPVTRIGPPLAPILRAPLDLAKDPYPEQAICQEAKTCVRILRKFGLNFNLAPVLDLADETAPPFLVRRTFGKDPVLAASLGEVYITTLCSEGILCCAKHFPGLGEVLIDPHENLPCVRMISQYALYPFRIAVKIGVPAIMTTHLLVQELDLEPATFSWKIIKILRQDLGFKGAILTDDLNMGAISKKVTLSEAILKSILAGHDLVLIAQDFWQASSSIKEFLKETKKSKVLRSRVEEAIARIKILISSIV